jgi:hypothetical protein
MPGREAETDSSTGISSTPIIAEGNELTVPDARTPFFCCPVPAHVSRFSAAMTRSFWRATDRHLRFLPENGPERRPTWPGASGLIRPSSGAVSENRLTLESAAMDLARCRQFFLDADSATYHRQYEALRAIFVDRLPQTDVADKYGYTHGSMRQLVRQFRTAIGSDSSPPFFRSRGSGGRRTSRPTARTNRQRPPLPTSEPARSSR